MFFQYFAWFLYMIQSKGGQNNSEGSLEILAFIFSLQLNLATIFILVFLMFTSLTTSQNWPQKTLPMATRVFICI